MSFGWNFIIYIAAHIVFCLGILIGSLASKLHMYKVVNWRSCGGNFLDVRGNSFLGQNVSDFINP